jgi:hypothetical protein
MMKAIGLQPSSTGMVGGKETGQHMSDYEIPGGPFSTAFSQKRSVSEPAIGPPARSEGWCPQQQDQVHL